MKLTAVEANRFLSSKGSVDLGEYTEMDDDAAGILANSQEDLLLTGLSRLSLKSAQALASRNGKLDLSGLPELEDWTASVLAQCQGRLALRNLQRLEDGVGHLALAGKLATQEGRLNLSSLTTLGDKCAMALSKHRGRLNLSGMSIITEAAADALSKHEGVLDLAGLKELGDRLGFLNLARKVVREGSRIDYGIFQGVDEETADMLSQRNPIPWLRRLQTLPDTDAHLKYLEGVLKGSRDMDFSSLRKIGLKAAEMIVQNQDTDLDFSGLKEMQPELASILGKNSKKLNLSGLEAMDQECARILAGSAAKAIDLSGLADIHDEVAKEFSKYKGELDLSGLVDSVTQSLARIFSTYKAYILDLSGITQLTTDIARDLKEYKGYLRLNGVRRIDANLSAVLLAENLKLPDPSDGMTEGDTFDEKILCGECGSEGNSEGICYECGRKIDTEPVEKKEIVQEYGLSIKGISHMDANAARVAAKYHSHEVITFMNVTELSDEAARILVNAKMFLTFPSLRVIDVDTATELAKSPRSMLLNGLGLNGLDDLSVEVAKALAQYEGCSLHLSSLRHITKEAAECLSHFKGDELILWGLEEMDGSTALLLSPLGERLFLSNNIKLSKSAQFILHMNDVGLNYNNFPFPDLSDISETEAYEISKSYAREDILESLCDLPDSDGFLVLLRKILFDEKNWTDTSYLRKIGPRAAAIILERYVASHIDLSGLEEIGTDVAGILSRHRGGKLDLSGLHDISTETAMMLSEHSGLLNLSGLDSLSDQAAEYLSNHIGEVKLKSTIKLSNEAREIIAGKGWV